MKWFLHLSYFLVHWQSIDIIAVFLFVLIWIILTICSSLVYWTNCYNLRCWWSVLLSVPFHLSNSNLARLGIWSLLIYLLEQFLAASSLSSRVKLTVISFHFIWSRFKINLVLLQESCFIFLNKIYWMISISNLIIHSLMRSLTTLSSNNWKYSKKVFFFSIVGVNSKLPAFVNQLSIHVLLFTVM